MSSRIPRLAYGFLSSSLDPINMKLPWQFSERDGLFKMNYKPEAAMKDNLKFWANTNRGEYLMDANFGLDVRRHVFDPIPLMKENILRNAKEQLPVYFPDFRPQKIEVLTKDEISEISENTIIFKLEGYLVIDKTRNINLEEKIGL